ncbi:MAG: hypothetical protein PHY48_16410, partial [Candidatus Cloacimonetes bacterium]|nr:hypothetical protein [Candidatus Cloacimonadota bacterium]
MKSSTFYILHSTLIRPFHILHFTFYILLAFAMMSCTSPTKPKTGTLSGRVTLVNDTDDPSLDPIDFSGVTVALYELAVMDPTIVRINQEYPQIGVQISQDTEFDHRLHNPVAVVTSDAQGDFEFDKVAYAEYNVVVMKNGWGVRYIHGVIVNSESTWMNVDDESTINAHEIRGVLPSVSLWPIIEVSPTQLQDVHFMPKRTYLITMDTVFLSSALFGDGSILLINPGCSVSFYGSTIGQSVLCKITITSSDGFHSVQRRDAIAPFNRMHISNTYESSVLLDGFKVSYLNDGLSVDSPLAMIINCIFRNSSSVAIRAESTCQVSMCLLTQNMSYGIIAHGDVAITSSVFTGNLYGCYIYPGGSTLRESIFESNNMALRLLVGDHVVTNCEFVNNKYAISMNGSSQSITLTSFNLNEVDIEFNRFYNGGITTYCAPNIF